MRKWVPITAVAVLAAGGALAFTLTTRAEPPPVQPPATPKTVAVVKTDLADSQEFKGELGFGAAQPVRGRRPGTVTWLPAPGAEIDRGQPLYKVDNGAVPLFLGDTPLWRKLDKVGIKGPDVKLVRDNLAALGYKSGGAGDEWTQGAIDAVKRWQKAAKAEETGVVDAGDVVVLPGKVRVQTVTARLSSPGDGELMSVTAPGKAVSASVETSQVEVFAKDAKVTIILPSGTETPGTVRSVSSNVVEEKNGEKSTAKTAVDIGLDDLAAVSGLDSGPVRIKISRAAKQGVLAVPVTALLALREGGYAVQAEDGSMLAVKTGLFAGGLVEISGGGLREGLKVVTTS
ncbi:peptidoglycan-binding protein [Lentzea tibetensis]|uniref:peptidoglycan-binding protein n=1 Tax=Lentzea tibetensis TaxID=2591470 RepID=UPI001645F936|nr:peptidoglycan-binding protein [Lentzea tibetensis]